MNIYEIPGVSTDKELVSILVENKNIRIERIISTGQQSDWYDQTETEYVILLEGKAQLLFENDAYISLEKGDTLLILPHQKHRVTYTSEEPPCIWLCVFY